MKLFLLDIYQKLDEWNHEIKLIKRQLNIATIVILIWLAGGITFGIIMAYITPFLWAKILHSVFCALGVWAFSYIVIDSLKWNRKISS